MAEILIKNGILRDMKPADIERIVKLASDEEIQRYFFLKPPKDPVEYWQLRYLKQTSLPKQTYNFPIFHEDTLKGIVTFDEDIHYFIPDKGFFMMSYFIGKDYRKNGLAQESVLASMRHLFEIGRAGIIAADCFSENQASRNLLAKIGMKERGEHRISKGKRNLVRFDCRQEDLIKT